MKERTKKEKKLRKAEGFPKVDLEYDYNEENFKEAEFSPFGVIDKRRNLLIQISREKQDYLGYEPEKMMRIIEFLTGNIFMKVIIDTRSRWLSSFAWDSQSRVLSLIEFESKGNNKFFYFLRNYIFKSNFSSAKQQSELLINNTSPVMYILGVQEKYKEKKLENLILTRRSLIRSKIKEDFKSWEIFWKEKDYKSKNLIQTVDLGSKYLTVREETKKKSNKYFEFSLNEK